MDKPLRKSKQYFQAVLANQSLGLQRDRVTLKRLEDSLVNRDEVNADIRRLHTQITDSWRAWPKQVATELAGRIKAEPAQVEALLQKHVDEQLKQFGNDCPTL